MEEWTDFGTLRFKTAIENRNWRKTEAQDFAKVLARTLDIAKDSELDIANEPLAELPLRELAAL